MNLIRIRFYSQLLRKDCPLSNKMCTHEFGIAVVWVMLDTPLTKINRSLTG